MIKTVVRHAPIIGTVLLIALLTIALVSFSTGTLDAGSVIDKKKKVECVVDINPGGLLFGQPEIRSAECVVSGSCYATVGAPLSFFSREGRLVLSTSDATKSTTFSIPKGSTLPSLTSFKQTICTMDSSVTVNLFDEDGKLIDSAVAVI